MEARGFLTAAVLALALCAPSAALSEEENSSGLDDMKGSISVGYKKVDEANSYTFEIDFTIGHVLFGGGFFVIDNGNLPEGIRDEPPQPGVNTIDVGKFNENETAGYIKCGGVLSGFRAFGLLGASDVTTKYVVKSTQSDIHYVTEKETGDFKMIYGAGVGYLIFDRVLVQYQYDNRRKNLFLAGISF